LCFFFRIFLDIQGDFEGGADILTCDRTPQKVTIELIMPYTNVDYFDEKGPSDFQQKHHSRLFLLSLNSKLSHFDKNVNFSPTWRKSI
jgi:hypothetical protein